MTLKSSYHQLADLHKSYRQQWQLVRETWQDKNADQFQKDYVDSLNRQVSSSLDAIQELDELFCTIKDEFSHE